MQPLSSTAKAFGMVKQEEKQREGILPRQTTPSVMSSIRGQASDLQQLHPIGMLKEDPTSNLQS